MPNSNLLDADINKLILGGLVLLLVAVVVSALFWRMSRRSRLHATESPPPQPIGPEPPQAAPVTPAAPPEVTLEFPAATGQSVIFKLDKPALTVGRAPDNDIVIPEAVPQAETISKHHARLRRDQDDYIVRDLNSRNGLSVNGRQTLENLLQDGDRLRFGSAEAIFHRPVAGTSAIPASGPETGGAA
jgi:pSer/pThr/pTyr-binding forkhead associated (FHA) protein